MHTEGTQSKQSMIGVRLRDLKDWLNDSIDNRLNDLVDKYTARYFAWLVVRLMLDDRLIDCLIDWPQFDDWVE